MVYIHVVSVSWKNKSFANVSVVYKRERTIDMPERWYCAGHVTRCFKVRQLAVRWCLLFNKWIKVLSASVISIEIILIGNGKSKIQHFQAFVLYHFIGVSENLRFYLYTICFVLLLSCVFLNPEIYFSVWTY